jgi:manganese efflux pump family protein
VIALLLVALSLGLTNFAGSVSIGVGGVEPRLRLRVVVVFGAFEALMPIIGLLLGHAVARGLGHSASVVGGVLLGLAGLYGVLSAVRTRHHRTQASASSTAGWGHLTVVGFALSMDNLVVGFALGAYHVSLVEAVVVIALVSVAMSLVGLELGDRIGDRLGPPAQFVGALCLTAVGVAIGLGAL